MLPYKIYTNKKIFNYYTGLSFFIFIWISRQDDDEVTLVRHEKIHFWQQVEMLFIFHWLFYAFFYLVARAKGHCHYIAYRYNPFELEAFNNEYDVNYLNKRKPFAWVRCVNHYVKSLSQDLKPTVPKEKFLNWKSVRVTNNRKQA
ncbi:hypothetical protein [Chryseosolibacter indicus]|uniref:DUF4157 domain-containing protein n=1 Tax=Chryseosolibacter indicus TaxID=2782351 RepID=A0ABS5VSI2_9BACT|nr:hypothetical protein [Chryseosolibacter indicus]MBT1703988.1 hypothetical protein [Chryseosolibacter indicus]